MITPPPGEACREIRWPGRTVAIGKLGPFTFGGGGLREICGSGTVVRSASTAEFPVPEDAATASAAISARNVMRG